jgi:23S rRNA (pseudouridine1915-N3)-methyltransferase
MLNIHIFCVGKLKEKFYTEASAEYVKRLSAYCKLDLQELPEERLPDKPSQAQIDAALAKEADTIRSKIPASSEIIAMCVEGKTRSSEELARLMEDSVHQGGSHLVFLIGGSFGLHPSVKALASFKLSMSPMTFPHHLARIMVMEQLYRSEAIQSGSKYHK